MVTGLSSTSTSSKKATMRSRKRSAVRGRTMPVRRTIRPNPGVRAAARLERGAVEAEVLGVVLGADHPAGHRAGRRAQGDRRVPADDRVARRRQQGDDRVDGRAGGRVGADAGTGDRVESAMRSGRPGRRGAGLLPRQHRVGDGEVGHRGRQRAVDGHARPAVGTDVGGDDAAARLERDQPARRGREAQGAHAVVAVRERHRPEATAAALPPELPAGDRAVSQGLRLTAPGPSVAA